MKSPLLMAEDLLSISIQSIGVHSYSRRYLSQNLFAGESDFSVRKESDLSQLRNIREAQVLFVKSEFLRAVFEILSARATRKIVLVGDSDFDWPLPPNNVPKSVKGMFIQNLLGGHSSKFRTLPIGIEGWNYGRNGLPHLHGRAYQALPKSRKIMIGPFANTHSERKNLIGAEFQSRQIEKSAALRISSLSQALKSSSSSHVLCPRGNGMDTHRFWETIYRGSRPIVKTSAWATSIRTELGDLFDVVESFEETNLVRVLDESVENPSHQISTAMWPHWREQIRTLLLS